MMVRIRRVSALSAVLTLAGFAAMGVVATPVSATAPTPVVGGLSLVNAGIVNGGHMCLTSVTQGFDIGGSLPVTEARTCAGSAPAQWTFHHADDTSSTFTIEDGLNRCLTNNPLKFDVPGSGPGHPSFTIDDGNVAEPTACGSVAPARQEWSFDKSPGGGRITLESASSSECLNFGNMTLPSFTGLDPDGTQFWTVAQVKGVGVLDKCSGSLASWLPAQQGGASVPVGMAFGDATSNSAFSINAAGTGIGTGHGMAANTSAATLTLPSGDTRVAFEDNSDHLFVTRTDGSPQATGLAMAPNTSPAVTTRPGGVIEVAYQGADHDLHTAFGDLVDNSHMSDVNVNLGMDPKSSPSITERSDGTAEIAVQANTHLLFTVDGTGKGTPGTVTMAAGTSPSIASNGRIAVAMDSAHNLDLAVVDADRTVHPVGLGLMPGTSPSAAVGTTGALQVAVHANNNSLFLVGEDFVGRPTNLLMDPTSSPSISAGGTGFVAAVQANTHVLFTVNTAGTGTPSTVTLATGASPAIDAP